MKSLHLLNAYHEASGGIRTYYDRLTSAAIAEGRRLHLVVPGAADEDRQLSETVRVSTVRAPASPVVDRRYRLVMPHRFVVPRRGRVWRLLLEAQPDVIEIADKLTWCYLGGLVKGHWRRVARGGGSHAVGRPMVVGFSHERLDDSVSAHVTAGRVGAGFAAAYMKHVYVPQCDAHLANSPYTSEEITRTVTRLRHGSLAGRALDDVSRVVTLGVDEHVWSPARRSCAARQHLVEVAERADAVIVLYAGRLSPEKHLMVLPAMMAILRERDPRFHLFLVGDGPLRGPLTSAGRALGTLHVLDHCRDKDALAALYASADLFVHPNPREPFGLAPLEAMACGLPVVLPDGGGVRAYAGPANAWLTDTTSADGLAETVLTAWASREERTRRRDRALLTARDHAWPHVFGRLWGTYLDLHERFVRYEHTRGYRAS